MNALSPITAAEPIAAPVRVGAIISPAEPKDWELLVSPGHVLGERLKRFGRVTFVPAFAAFLAALACAYGVVNPAGVQGRATPAWIAAALDVDPNTYADLGGGKRGPWQLSYLAGLPKTKGLTPDAWSNLVNSAGEDFIRNGEAVDRWTKTPELATAPKITRPEKAFTEHAGRLDTGLVVLRSKPWPLAHIVANVDGGLAWAVVRPGSCAVLFGPVPPACSAGDLNAYAPDVFALRPQVTK